MNDLVQAIAFKNCLELGSYKGTRQWTINYRTSLRITLSVGNNYWWKSLDTARLIQKIKIP